MRKSVFGLVVAGATLAGAIGSAGSASGITISISGQEYSYFILNTAFSVPPGSPKNTEIILHGATWGNDLLAAKLAELTSYDSVFFPVDEYTDCCLNVGYKYIGGYENHYPQWTGKSWHPVEKVLNYGIVQPVPWDLDGSATIFGSIAGIGLGVGLRRLKNEKTSTSKNS
jgi:hypothetical protein